MEIRAVIEALRWLDPETPAIVWTDSAYVFRQYRAWRRGWMRANWTRGPTSALANADLRETLEQLLAVRNVDVRWIRGHAETLGNERADELAKVGRLRR